MWSGPAVPLDSGDEATYQYGLADYPKEPQQGEPDSFFHAVPVGDVTQTGISRPEVNVAAAGEAGGTFHRAVSEVWHKLQEVGDGRLGRHCLYEAMQSFDSLISFPPRFSFFVFSPHSKRTFPMSCSCLAVTSPKTTKTWRASPCLTPSTLVRTSWGTCGCG